MKSLVQFPFWLEITIAALNFIAIDQLLMMTRGVFDQHRINVVSIQIKLIFFSFFFFLFSIQVV